MIELSKLISTFIEPALVELNKYHPRERQCPNLNSWKAYRAALANPSRCCCTTRDVP